MRSCVPPILVLVVGLSAGVASADPEAVEPAVMTAWDRSALEELVRVEARRQGLDPRLVRAVVSVESGWDHQAVSRKGARGLMQLMPATASRLGVVDPFDPAQNVRGGVAELVRLVDRFGGNLQLALAAYNAGEGAVRRYRGVPPYRETRSYIRRVMTLYTGRDYTFGDIRRARAPVRVVRDPVSGRTVITNVRKDSAAAGVEMRPSSATAGRLSGGFGAAR